MKKLNEIIVLVAFIGSFIWMTPQKVLGQNENVSFQIFYDELSPYGTWVQSPDYGYVWVPDVDAGFEPYSTNGYWIYSDAGWTWVSNYSWGWAPFHYGRWYNDASYGPIWVPDNEWGPGWVTWRRSEGYYGWTPIAPGISISVAYSNSYNVPNERWVFVHDRDFGRRNINNYYVNRSQNVTIISHSTVINNVRSDRSSNSNYQRGPSKTEVQQRSGKTISPVVIKETNRPGEKVEKNELQLYKPKIQRNSLAEAKSAPTKVAASLSDVKRENRQSNVGQEPKQNPKSQPSDNKAVIQQHGEQPMPNGTVIKEKGQQRPVNLSGEQNKNTGQHRSQAPPINLQPSSNKSVVEPVQRKITDNPIHQPQRPREMNQPVHQELSQPKQEAPHPINNQPVRNIRPVEAPIQLPQQNVPRPPHQEPKPQNDKPQQASPQQGRERPH